MKTTREKKFSYDFRVDKIPYHVEVSPYLYNEQKRFIININGAKTISIPGMKKFSN
ncbi:MAG: hypothetical protein WDO19_14300 [Bacteroidota bacterium]